MIQITPQLAIPESDLRFTFSASPGPGGQNVNKVATKVTLWFDLAGCRALSDAQRARLQFALRQRVGADGLLRVVRSASRSQAENRRQAVEALREMIAQALRPPRTRRRTRPTAASKERRLEAKRQRSQRKRDRGGGAGRLND